MTIETATYISDLVAANPGATDPKSEGDDQIRLIKNVLKATLPNASGAITPTHTVINNLAAGTFPTVAVTGVTDITTTGNTILGDATTDTFNQGAGSLAKNAAGNWTIGVPSSGISVSTTNIAGQSAYQWTDGTRAGAIQTSAAGNFIGSLSADPFNIFTNGIIRIAVNNTGNVTIAAPSSGDTITVNGATSGSFRVNATGLPYGNALHNNAGAVTGTTNQCIASGTYTPTLTNVANTTARSANVCQWMRVGNVVTVSGIFTITPTASAANTSVNFTLPIASAFANIFEAGGQAIPIAFAGSPVGYIAADSVAAQAVFTWQSSAGSAGISSQFPFSFTYLVR